MRATPLLVAALLSAQQAHADREIHLVHAGPGCLGERQIRVGIVGALYDHFGEGKSASVVTRNNFSALARDGRILVPEPAAAGDGDAVPSFLEGDGPVERIVLAERAPVLVGDHDLAFQWPLTGHADWLAVVEDAARRQDKLPDLRRTTGRIVRFARGGGSILALELDEGAAPRPLATDLYSYDRQYLVASTMKVAGEDVHVYALGRVQGAPARVKARLDGLKRELPAGSTVLLHGGDVVATGEDGEAATSVCGKVVGALGFDAVVPRGRDLSKGVDGLRAFADAERIPYVAANLRDARADAAGPTFPPYRLLHEDGVAVAVIGVVDPAALAGLPRAAASQWRIEDPVLATRGVLDDVRVRLQRWPDLVVVLGRLSDADRSRLERLAQVDVVFGGRGRSDLLEVEETVRVEPGAREATRAREPLLRAATSSASVGHVVARFVDGTAGGPPALASLSYVSRAVTDEDPEDAELKRVLRVLEEEALERGTRVLFPSAERFIAAHDELQQAAYGDRVLTNGSFSYVPRFFVPIVTDPMWMRFVVNVLREDTRAEVVIARNLPRSASTLGDINRFILEDWLSSDDALVWMELKGSDLIALAKRIVAQQEPGAFAGSDFLFAAGLKADAERVQGRPIRPEERYSVVVTESALALHDVRALLAGKPAIRTFVADDRGGHRPDAGGEPLLVRAVVFEALEENVDPATGHVDPARADAVLARMLDKSGEVEDRIATGFDELALAGQVLANSPNASAFAASGESRLVQPNVFQLGLRANGFALYDGPWLALEQRVRAQLDSFFSGDGGLVPVQELRDDLVASTELRLNKVNLGVGGEAFQIVPFVQLALDTELTPTRDPARPGATLPHQLLVRESAGLVASPGGAVREVRLGALVQQDVGRAFADPQKGGGVVGNDWGLTAGYKARVPLLWKLHLESELDARYLVPDGDDRQGDLALRLQAIEKLVVPVTEGASFFLFVDVFVVSGKLDENREPAWNAIVGAGLDFARVLKL